MHDQLFGYPTYLVRKKLLKLIGGRFDIYGPDGEPLFFCNQKAFKLKEDIRVYACDADNTEVLTIMARQRIDFGATYDVVDTRTGEQVGALRRKGLQSMLKDEWAFLDRSDNETGLISEDNLVLALIRRLATNLIPQRYDGMMNGVPVCQFRQDFNPFVVKIKLDFTPDTTGLLDRRLGIAAAVLLSAVEGHQG